MRFWFASLCGAMCCVLATATPAQDRQQRYRVQLTEFQRLLDADAPAALKLAEGDVERARALKPDDQRRGDALERLSLALVRLERFDQALLPATTPAEQDEADLLGLSASRIAAVSRAGG